MEISRALNAAATLATALAVTGCCVCKVAPDPPPADLPVSSYLPGPGMANRVLRNVVRIDRPGNSQEKGLGLIVGRDQDGLIAVTAAHVVQDQPSYALNLGPPREFKAAAAVRVTFCADELARQSVEGVPMVIKDAIIKDIALIRLPFNDKFKIETRVLADLPVLRKGDEAWVAGREGDCQVGGSEGKLGDIANRAQIDEKLAANARILVNLPGANESTSGGALLTGRGVVGILRVLHGGVTLVEATDIESVRNAVQTAYRMTWELQRSENLSPADPESARRELSEALNVYLLNVRTNHQMLGKEKLNEGELASVVASYNRSITSFFAVMNKHDGTLDRYWGKEVREMYQATRQSLLSVHWTFLALSEQGLVDDMYRTRSVAPVVRTRMATLVAPLDVLQSSISDVIAALSVPIKEWR